MENNDLKVFIYDNNGKKIDEKNYDLLQDTFDEVINYNIINQNNIYNIYIGNNFPPKNYEWDDSNKNWKDLNNNFLKIFIYNNRGELIKEEYYHDFLKIYSDVFNYNNSNIDDQKKLYYGSQFPPPEHVWSNQLKDWILIVDNQNEIISDEIAVEEIYRDEFNNLLKVYVYNTRGEMIKEDFYYSFLNIYDYVLNHNASNPNDPYNIYPGTEFPPKGYKWSNDKGDWVELTLYEKHIKGKLDIPNDCVFINNILVRKNLSTLHREGLIKILPTQKIDEELNMIVDKNNQELIDEGLVDWNEIYNYYYLEFKKKLDTYLDLYYFKYPKMVSFQFADKTRVAKLWKSLNQAQKEFSRVNNYQEFLLLISEFKDLNRDYTLDEIDEQLDLLSDKIIRKNSEIEVKMGLINNLFDSLYAEITEIKETRNFYKLFDFVASIENRINQWIKS